jgi:hypothetical protein
MLMDFFEPFSEQRRKLSKQGESNPYGTPFLVKDES